MGAVTFYKAALMGSSYFAGGDVDSYDESHVTFSFGAHLGTYYGDFKYTATSIRGTVTGYSDRISGVLQYEASGLKMSVAKVINYMDNDDAQGMVEEALAKADTFTGSSEDDLIYSYAGNDSVTGNAGDDTLNGGAGNDNLDGGNDADVLNGDAGNDSMSGGAGADTLNGGAGNDNIGGGSDEDSLSGNAGKDTLHGDGGDDTLSGGDGNDLVDGDEDNDDLSGGEGKDTVVGENGNDTLRGDAGNDSLSGGEGDDELSGGEGKDTLDGGNGDDTYIFDSAPAKTNIDTIVSFGQTGGDTDLIQLDITFFGALAAPGTLTADEFFAGTAAHDSTDRIIYDQATGKLLYDVDGNGAIKAIQIAVIGVSTHPTLSNTDFTIIS